MRVPFVLAPIAVLGSACTLRPFTPSTTLVTWSQSVPAGVDQLLPSADSAISRWQLPPDLVWSRFSKNTLLSSLDADADDKAVNDYLDATRGAVFGILPDDTTKMQVFEAGVHVDV